MTVVDGRTVCVTGVTSGIGRVLAGLLVEGGARVIGVGRNPETLARVGDELGARFTAVVADLADPEAVIAAVHAIREAAPRLDALVCNAAECVYATPTKLSPARWQRLLQVNVLANVTLVNGVSDLIPPGGNVLLVSSVTARHVAHPAFGPYGLTKTALEQLAETLRMELAPRGIAVGTVTPGLVDTPIYAKVDGFERQEARMREAIPTWLSPADVASTLVWMLTRPEHVVIADVVLLPRGQPR